MVQIGKVFLYTILFLLVYGQERSKPRRQEEGFLDLVALSRLLQTAARLAYPISKGITAVVDNLRNVEKPSVSTRHHNPRYPLSRTDIRNNVDRSRDDLKKSRNMNDRGVNRWNYDSDYDYEYQYEYDDEYMEPLVSFEETDDEVVPEVVQLSINVPNHKLIPGSEIIEKPLPYARTISRRKPSQSQVSNAPANTAAGNLLPATTDAPPKIIYVIINPGDVNPEMNKDNTILLSRQEFDSGGIKNTT